MKVRKISSKTLGELTGKIVAGATALPGKTSETTGSIKREFLAGYKSVNGSNKVKGSDSVIDVD